MFSATHPWLNASSEPTGHCGWVKFGLMFSKFCLVKKENSYEKTYALECGYKVQTTAQVSRLPLPTDPARSIGCKAERQIWQLLQRRRSGRQNYRHHERCFASHDAWQTRLATVVAADELALGSTVKTDVQSGIEVCMAGKQPEDSFV